MMIAALLAFLPTMLFGWSASYYAKVTVGLTNAPTGEGTVYAGDKGNPSDSAYFTETKPVTCKVDKSGTSGSAPASADVSIYLSAKAGYGSKFDGWYDNAAGTGTAMSSSADFSFTKSSSGKSETAAVDAGSYYAKFVENTHYTVSVVKPDVGLTSYTITGPTGFDGSGLSNGGELTAYTGESYDFKCTVADGYEFVKWMVNGADAGTSTTLTKTFSSASTVQAVVNKLVTYYATCQAAPASCSYKVGSTVVSADEYQTSGYGTLTVNLSAPTAASGYMFAGWYEIVDGNKTIISTDASTTVTKKSDVTLGADFVAITAPVMLVTFSGIVDYDDFDAAFSAAKSGDKLKVVGNGTLTTDAYVNPGVTLEVASGVTLAVADGATLYIDGSATVNGAISGMVSKCTKLIQQTGDGTVNEEIDKPNPYIPYDGVKYWRTTTTTPSISVSSADSHITIVNGYGKVFRTSATTAKALVCTVDMSTAVNHITSIDTDFTSFTSAYENARQSATAGSGTSQSIKGNSKLIVMLANDTSASESGDQRYGFMVDCAGCNLAFTATLKSNYDVVILNCPYTGGNQLKSTVTNTRVHFFNCTKAGVKINSKNSTIVNCYDCGDLSISYDPSTVQSGEVNIYSGGPYSASFNKLWHIYGGTFKSKPSTDYLWDSTNYEIQPEGSNWKVAEKKKTEYVAYTLTGTTTTEYESLSEAIGAVVNGGTVFLMQDIELEADLQIGAGREVTIEMTGCDISGHNIVNAGILHLEDRKMTSNPGTVSSGIVNNGTITIAYGEYAGSIQLNGGMFTVYNGTVDGSVTVASSVADPATVVNLKGGQFASRSFLHGSETKDISTICEAAEAEHVVRAKNGRFRVARFPAAVVTDTGTMSLSAVAFKETDSALWTRFVSAPTRANFAAAEWYRACELQSAFDYYQTQGIDCAVIVDRPIAAGTLSISAPVIGTQPINSDILVSEFGFSALLPMVRDYPHTPQYAPWAYSTFLPGGEHSSVSFGLINGDPANNGTLIIVQMRLASDIQSSSGKKDYSYTQYDVIGSRRYVIGAGSDKAMIRPEVGAATFYAKVTDALAAAEDGATVMLTQDCEEDVVLAKAGSFTIDQNGFALTGSVTAGGDYFVEKAEDGTYTVAKKGIVDENGKAQASIQEVVDAAGEGEKEVVITIPETTTEQTVELPQDTTLTVVQAEGSETVVNVTPAVGYFVEATVVEPTEEQSGTTTVYESKKITEEVVTVTKETVQELNVKLEEFQAGSTETNEVSEVAQIVKAVNNLMENKALERADNVEQAKSETISLKAIVITPKAIVQEVAAESEKVVKAAAFDVTPTDTNNNKIENTSFTFRLPVADGMTGSMVVFHEKKFFGVYPILSWSDGAKLHKYIEITSSEFSEYSYEPRRGVEYAVAKIGDVGYDSLEDAVAAAAAGAKVELLKSTTLTNEIAVAKTVTLDLGEFTVTAASGKSAIQVVADGNLTVQGTGKIVAESTKFALYTDYELSQGAKTITIKGGVFDGAVQFNKYPLHTSATQSGEAAVPTRVTIDGGTFNGRVSIYHAPFTVNGGTFEQGLDTSDGSVTVYANYRTPVTFNGGGFRVRPTPAGSRVVVNGGVYYDNGYFKVGSTAACQATRNGTYYASLAEAFANIGPNTVITVLDGDVSSISVSLEPGQSLTVPHPFAGTIAGKGGAALDITYDNTSGTATYRVREAGLARIEGTYYPTLQAAFDAAVAGNTVTLLGDATLAFTTLDRAITLDLNGHDVTVTSGAANLSAGALTVVGAGRMTGLVEPSAGKINLVLKGGTYGFNPSKYVPSVIEALPNEKDSLDWSNDRHYVFRNAAFVDGYWTTDSGVWTVVPVPKAYVSRIAEAVSADAGAPLDAAYTFNSFNPDNGDSAIADKVITGDGQLNLNALTDPAEIARALVVLQEAMPFLGWHADFAVSFDKPIAAGSLTLAGQYDGWSSSWVSYSAPNAVAANVIRRLLVDEGGASVNDWSFEHICTKVKVFNCGARQEEDSLAGTTMKVQLRLYAPETDEGTGSPSIGICEYKYTFGGKAARIGETTYDTIDAAIAQVQSNDVVVVLNDYTGTVNLNECDKPFTVNRNGFVLEVTATNNINTAEGSDWHFDRLSNGSWSYYNKPQPKSVEEAVVMVEVVAEDGEAVSLSTLTPTQAWLDEKTEAGETSAEQAVTKVEENGLQAWQNYVIGQNPTAAVRVDTEQAPINNTPVANTLTEKVNVPADSGFTVTYELDKIEVDGTVVEGTPQSTAENFNIDLEAATDNESGAAYFKMTAVIEATDGTGAKTKVASENTIGVLKVESSATSTVIAVPWESLAANEQDITVADLVRTATLSEGDELKVYDTATGKYRAWTLNESKEWEPVTVVGGAESEEAGDSTIARGSGVWLTRQDTTKPIYLVGEVAEQSTTTTIAGANEEKPTWNLVAAPTVEAVDLNEKFPDANEGDVVLVPTDGAPKRYTYKDGSWGYDDYVKTFNKKGIEVVKVVRKTDVANVPIGTGFWYMNAGDDQNVEW